jgi:hypothetical protein
MRHSVIDPSLILRPRAGCHADLMGSIDDANLQVGLDSDLAGETRIGLEVRLASQSLLFGHAHRRGVSGDYLDAARGATCVAATAVQDIDPSVFDTQH